MNTPAFTTDVTDIQPIIGMTLQQVREVFEQLCRQYGSNAVVSSISIDSPFPCVQVEVPNDNVA